MQNYSQRPRPSPKMIPRHTARPPVAPRAIHASFCCDPASTAARRAAEPGRPLTRGRSDRQPVRRRRTPPTPGAEDAAPLLRREENCSASRPGAGIPALFDTRKHPSQPADHAKCPGTTVDYVLEPQVCKLVITDAGWSSSVARWAHNPEVAGSNPVPATTVARNQGSGPHPFSTQSAGFASAHRRASGREQWERAGTAAKSILSIPTVAQPPRAFNADAKRDASANPCIRHGQ